MDTVVESPIGPPLVEELFEFWIRILGGPLDVTPESLLGHEGPEAQLTVYLSPNPPKEGVGLAS